MMQLNKLPDHTLSGFWYCLLFLIVSFSVSAQTGLQKLTYTYYTSWFSTIEHIPLVVSYTLTEEMLSCTHTVTRTNKFKPDPAHKEITNLAKDYRRSGYDRGHNMNAADNECSVKGMEQCFYFSNMTPQPHSFNAGRWEDLEKLERIEATQSHTLIITCGSIGVKEYIGEDKVAVPNEMWKVIYTPATEKYQCYLFPNSDEGMKELDAYKVTLSKIEKLTALCFEKGVVEVKAKDF